MSSSVTFFTVIRQRGSRTLGIERMIGLLSRILAARRLHYSHGSSFASMLLPSPHPVGTPFSRAGVNLSFYLFHTLTFFVLLFFFRLSSSPSFAPSAEMLFLQDGHIRLPNYWKQQQETKRSSLPLFLVPSTPFLFFFSLSTLVSPSS